jgi:hypothetical protein
MMDGRDFSLHTTEPKSQDAWNSELSPELTLKSWLTLSQVPLGTPFDSTVNGLGLGQGPSSGPGPSWEFVLRYDGLCAVQ